jgi:sporulation protein YlmC with PRC-barrel domain
MAEKPLTVEPNTSVLHIAVPQRCSTLLTTGDDTVYMPQRPRGTELIGKTIVSEEHGKRFGEVEDMSFVAGTGELMNLLITDTTDHLDDKELQDDRKGRNIIPFSAVRSMGDFVIVSEDDII